jgi:hypothetical protein
VPPPDPATERDAHQDAEEQSDGGAAPATLGLTMSSIVVAHGWSKRGMRLADMT